MNNSEKLCLQWNDFKESIVTSFSQLREDTDLTDVTLVCEDGKQVEAHKVVLVASSPFFLDILSKNKHTHPLIYMRGLKHEDLVSIMDFLYMGEANIFQDKLDSFLKLAEDLQLKGLTRTGDDGKDFVAAPTKREILSNKDYPTFQEVTSNPSTDYPDFKQQVVQGDRPTTSVVALSSDPADLDSQIRSMITKSDVRVENGSGRMAKCNVCGKEGPYNSMPRHVEALHITGVSHPCDVCGKMFRSRHALSRHKCSNQS